MSTEPIPSCSGRRTNLAQNYRGAKVSGGSQWEIVVSDRKTHPKNALRDFCSFTSSLAIHHCTIQQQKGAPRIGLPSRQHAKDDGTTSYTSMVEFASEIRDGLNLAVLRAIDQTLGGQE